MVLKHVGITAGLGVLASSASTLLGVSSATAAQPAETKAVDSKASGSAHAFTNLDGIHAEYLVAVKHFPFELPPNTSFPSMSSLANADENVVWEPDAGIGEAYLFWNNATAVAASDAHTRGDTAETTRLLDILDVAYSSPIREASWDDGGTYTQASKDARSGDFGALLQLTASSAI